MKQDMEDQRLVRRAQINLINVDRVEDFEHGEDPTKLRILKTTSRRRIFSEIRARREEAREHKVRVLGPFIAAIASLIASFVGAYFGTRHTH
jgi:hypothetical protein